ncbi:Small subunit (SSU) processome component [Talaromyces marneffei ATCC 18224]|uniref:Small nucleolar ribonucleoprotein complex component (Utp5), putative n=1 Tax=Talaromyces marneffei (strain ATCC 18224 / CBS 334.59 / QM 7333) TaxID=441960 RepID=B6QQ48_TALMQ|nr:uncharacterized protein EYB26_005258 [Talaromyces marneffei]EEA20196.1 small nucleolar ribonucleoprotein complex component (Utp5), putative [Talaromyces marneffei ATCC 18224]QGA17587.1 hypothetical protein EYB26_005258 [Talaromyces marneffei]
MGKKSSRPPASKTASAAQPAASGATVSGNKSSIIRAAFSPSEYQLALFASVIQGLDSQHLRIHDIHTGALQCEHSVAPKESITSLDWGYLGGQREQGSKKKRKRKSDVNGSAEDKFGREAVVAFGTSSSDIRMYSPAEDKVLCTLSGVHEGGIKDFKFTTGESTSQGWSIGGDNRLVQWDLNTRQSIRIINIPTTSTVSALSRPLLSNPPVICATQTPIILDFENSDAESLTFPSLTSPIHTLIPSSTLSVKDANFIAADNERYITVFDPKTQGIAYNLVAEQEVTSLSLSSQVSDKTEEGPNEKQVLAALVEDGTVELFSRPFSQTIGQNGTKATSQKARAKQMIRKADAILKILRPDTRKAVSAVQVGFQGPELYIAWAEGGVNVIFERVRWQDQDTGDLVFSGTTDITARKSASALKSAAVIEGQRASKSHVNENSTIVESGLYSEDVEMNDAHVEDDAVSISDAEDHSDIETETTQKRQTKKVNGVNGTSKDTDMQEAAAAEQDEDEEDEGGELTFGELVQRSSAIDVEAELEDNAGAGALVPGLSSNTNQTVAQIPSGVSLSTVLTQALKTNDSEMLESCFRTSDVNIIRTTVQRLNSALAGALIQRLAERMASRPGRYGHLLVWVQWTCVAHGGAIAGNTEILKRMTSLYKVMDQRSRSLPSLLLLKGKLDMLDAQINLRQSMADSRKHGMDDGGESLEHITHYAGVSNDDSDAERRRKRKKTLSHIKSKSALDGADEEADEDDEMADEVGGLASDSDEEEGSEEDMDEEIGDMIDIEAEESLDDEDDEEDDEDEEEEDSDAASDMRDFIADSEVDEELSADEVPEKISVPPPSKKSKLNHKSRR